MGDTHDFTDLIRIKIKILHSTTHTLSVERTVRLFFMVKNCVFPCVLLYSIMIPVRDLKQDICYYCGVSPERQPRLLFRGRVLKNDQRLSDYHVEEGHTLYLVKGSPPIPLFSSNAAANSNLGRGTLTDHSYQLTARGYDTPSVVIPDSITTLSRHLDRIRQVFATYGNNDDNNWQAPNRSREDLIARECHWGELAHTTRRLLIGEVAECLSNISMLLVDQVNVTDPSARRLRQERVVESGSLLCHLGSSILALGHGTSRISMGETQDDVGRAVFISPTGQNRLQSHHSWLQTSIRAGRRIRIISRRRSSRNQQHSDLYFNASDQNADNTSSPRLTTDEELSDSDSEHEMVNIVSTLNLYYSKAKKEMVGSFGL
ncbi:Ubiquitin-like superfamily protein [Arabidopsis thaliana]|uniref:Ubiquitin-like superfamily protein n=1 Tax=Arabidopsis thaliana TaxID=3702 RepID=F4JWE4_ARATH|nr:Ubiquitin-like superfamily protein [Arabidopsis thaliana]AED91633.1 Ubiquitin-like superfamily protein [Arabidopsis thaliana]|eukprot:NP_001190287.1 Ubiquitin-like superfamily protein [Arabidopsis thaliana]